MRRSALIFLAAILLPSFGLAWLAVHSVRDQQVVLEHQQAIISQNITDALAKNVQDRMDQVRGDFAQTTQQLISANAAPQSLAQDFNRKLRSAWPMAEIGFAVDLNGEIYSPKPYEGGNSKTFRDENDRFLSNRENVEVYASKALIVNQNGFPAQNTVTENSPIQQEESKKPVVDFLAKQESIPPNTSLTFRNKATFSVPAKDDGIQKSAPSTITAPQDYVEHAKEADKSKLSVTGMAMQAPAADANAPLPLAPGSAAGSDFASGSGAAPAAAAPTTNTTVTSRSEGKLAMADTLSATTPPPPATAVPTVTTAPSTPAPVPEAKRRDFDESASMPAAPPPVPTETQSASSSAGFLNSAAQAYSKIQRNVTPQQVLSSATTAPLSNTLPAESDFRRVIGTETSGTLARFLENKLRLMVWAHPEEATSIVFGAQLDQAKLVESLKASFPAPDAALTSSSRSSGTDYCLAILDDTGRPVALSQPGFHADWKHPFVATELGEVLPHWEAALYLLDPQQISRTARTLQFTLGLIVLLLIAAIVAGGSLIAADVRRQVLLAQQKTDFVSNVSHELKTPLTSIRMFADLLAEKRVPDEEKQTTYLRIIAAEAARLTRLINNVLDFARLERGADGGLRPGENHRQCDLVDAVLDVAETCQPHLETSGVSFRHEIETETLPITGDRDALAQIILNLISNAEKYGGKEILVRVRRQDTPAGALGCVDVLDRGPGIPAKQVKTVFEPFHRLDDSLSSGIPGSGLGLTLARRMARAHGGDVTYSARAGGGSCFTLSIPLGAS